MDLNVEQMQLGLFMIVLEVINLGEIQKCISLIGLILADAAAPSQPSAAKPASPCHHRRQQL